MVNEDPHHIRASLALIQGDPQLLNQFSKDALWQQAQFDRILLRHAEHLPKNTEQNKLRQAKQDVALVYLEWVKINRIFQAEGLNYANLKGPALSFELYGDFQRRQSRDVDILLHPDQVERSIDMLLAKGYQAESKVPSSKKQWAYLKKYRHHLCMINPEGSCTLEIHWRLLASGRYAQWDNADLLKRRVNLEDRPNSYPVLSPSDQFMYLCLHGARHAWMRLCWLEDALVYWQQCDDTTKVKIAQEIKKFGFEPFIASLLCLLKRYSVPYPPDMNLLADQSRFGQEYVNIAQEIRLAAWLHQGKTKVKAMRLFYKHLELLEGLQAVKLEKKQRKHKPENWQYLVFPDSLFFLNQWFSVPIWLWRKIF